MLLLLLLSLPAEEKLDPARYLTVIKGDLPIILSAPHGGRLKVPGVPERKGEGIAQFTTGRDENTAEMTLALAAILEQVFGAKPHVVVAHFERKYLDANRPATSAYEVPEARPLYDAYHAALDAACKQVQKDFGRGLLLDIHGQASDVDAIYRGTVNGKSVTLLTQRFGQAAVTGEKSILGVLAKKGYKVLPANDAADQKETKYNGGHIVQTYGSHGGSGIDALQLELGTALRAKKSQETLIPDLVAALEVFAKAYLPERKGGR